MLSIKFNVNNFPNLVSLEYLLILPLLPIAFLSSPQFSPMPHPNLTTLKVRALFSKYNHTFAKPFLLLQIGLLMVS